MIEWVNVKERVPEDRREILTWGKWIIPFLTKPRFLGITKYNPGSDEFDLEKSSWLSACSVTHWAEITGPQDV